MHQPKLKNKTIIISGASAGVGAATAKACAEEGANLVLLARGQEMLNKVAEELKEITQVLTFAIDVTDTKACEKMLADSAQTFGQLDMLINNAGYHQRGDVKANDPAELARMVDVNLRAPIELSAMILPYLEKSTQAAIVNVGSLAGRTPLQGAATYAATKAGLRAFTYSLADELQHSNINIGLVSPGPIDTGFIMSDINAVEDIVFSQPMSSPEQVARAIINVALGEAIEISLPKASGWLTMISYLFPTLRRKLRPSLYRKGRKAKEKYVNQYKKFQ